MKNERRYAKIVADASRNKKDLLEYADHLMISLDGTDLSAVDLGPVSEMIHHFRGLDKVRHKLKDIVNSAREGALVEANDLEQAQAMLPTVMQLFNAYKNAVNGVNAVLSK
jgi:hypothetical protein